MAGIIVVAVVFSLILIIVIVVLGDSGGGKPGVRRAALIAYRQALAALKAEPTNPDLREHAVKAGRTLANLSRDRNGRTLFDEVALMNDINAACAGAVASSATPVRPSAEERLRQLDSLLANNLISEAEYQTKRAQILSEV